ncbi:phosphoribosylamine--glycine ligase [Aurantiacibacter gangjinensis]|uniref:Phosphoribosylamine--glycine ligase n=1 Tax=Aurantiacibacter gangjinensis TaxID=502682 RepID=A0A0G9MQE2_9SPHN|nr:phosphoribosylamine--glycine ligase [Aurantiacibacter gangjinensis]APE27455.1 Phosphoribosylamine--glycine ligase [Aurantiacibacter gangjinensis]KLE31523.1 phosphoribosylamine--glycine ligase [Aurantiacibacter gangjinensis]
MNILVLGGGGREHALCWKLAQSDRVAKNGGRLFAAPGNPGMAECAELVTLDAKDHGAVASFCAAHAIGLVVIGPEAPLVDGLADSLRAADIAVFGPSKAAAQLEGSKNFTKALCDRAGIPTAGYVHRTSLEQARQALTTFAPPFVLKADGLAAGKGVVIADSEEHALEALEDMFGGAFGDAGAEVVIEEFMAGEEASFFALTDGETVLPFGTAQDHKRVGEGDTGPNTGGMGAYSPARVLTDELVAETMERIIFPTVRQLAKDGTPYSGVLYAGLMLTDDGPKLVEYNARFGDPECQVLMMRLQSDLADYMLACASGTLAAMPEPDFADDTAMTVVMAAKGYPGTPEKGGAIDLGDAEADGAKVFHAGTATRDGQLVANGGRVLNVTAVGADTKAAQDAAYRAVDAVDFPSGFVRRDIGWREVSRG